MTRLLTWMVMVFYAASAAALEDPPRTSATTWEIYGAVLVVFLVGFIWVFLQQRKQKEREDRKARRAEG